LADAIMAKGEIVILMSSDGVRRAMEKGASAQPALRDEPAFKQLHALASLMIDDLRISIFAIDFDPLGVIAHSLTTFNAESAAARLFAGGTNSDGPNLTRLANKPYYCALSVDVAGLGGQAAMDSLARTLNLPPVPAWISQTGGFQFAAYPSPAGPSGGLLNDAVVILQASQPAAARDSLKSQVQSLKNLPDGVKREVTWTDDQPLKNTAKPLSADVYEVKVLDVPPEQAMQQVISQVLFGRGGWKGFVKKTDDALVMTFSQRPAVLEAALNVQPTASIGSSGVIKTMHKWMPAHNDVELYISIGQLSQMARHVAQTFGAAENLPLPEFDASAPPIGFAAEIDKDSARTTMVIPAAILAPMIDLWTGSMMRRGPAADSQPEPSNTPSKTTPTLPGEKR
jgi:hypothetical protein